MAGRKGSDRKNNDCSMHEIAKKNFEKSSECEVETYYIRRVSVKAKKTIKFSNGSTGFKILIRQEEL